MSKNQEIALKLNELRTWFENNPKLPEDIDPMLLRRFLKCMYNDVEETKKLIEVNYALRNKHPNLFIERNPHDENTRKALWASDLVMLPGLTPDRCKVLLFRMTDMDPSTRNSVEETKIFFMLADCRFTMSDDLSTSTNGTKMLDNNTEEKCSDREDKEDIEGFYDAVDYLKEESRNDVGDDIIELAEGDIQVVDISGYTMRHCMRISISVFRAYLKFLQEAYPVRLRAMHLINCPAYLDKMIAFIKPFMNEDVYNLMHFHKDGLESLYEHIPRDMLPFEYGGKAGTMADLKANWVNQMEEKKQYLMDARHWYIKPTQQRSRWSWF